MCKITLIRNLTSFLALVFVTLVGSAQITPPSELHCDNDSFTWENRPNISGNSVNVGLRFINAQTYDIPGPYPAEFSGPITISISEAISWDGYSGRENVTQSYERWRIIFYNNGNVVHRTQYTGDVPDRVRSGEWKGALDQNIFLPNGTDRIVIQSFESGEGSRSSANSVVPTGICFEYEGEPGIEPPVNQNCDNSDFVWNNGFSIGSDGYPDYDFRFIADGRTDTKFEVPGPYPAIFSQPIVLDVNEIISYDAYPNRVNVTQLFEQWSIVFLRNGILQGQTRFTDEVPDRVAVGLVQGPLDQNIELPQGFDQIIIAHIEDPLYGDGSLPSPNSVIPVSICLSAELLCDVEANAGPDQRICEGETVTLSAANEGPGVTYTWSDGQTGRTIQVSPDSTTDYTVTVSKGQGCSDTDTVRVRVDPLPVAVAGDDVTICEGESVTLTATDAGPNVSYEWSNGENTRSITVSPTTRTTYTVTVTSDRDCEASDEVEVLINALPEITEVSTEGTCIDEETGSITITFPDNDGRTNIAFSIDGGDTYTSVPDNSGSFTFEDLAPGTYDLFVRWGNQDCPVDLPDATVEGEDKVNIGDFVFNDEDRDGIQDPGETGINGISVMLYQCNDGSNSGGTLVETTTTGDAGAGQPGFYNFEVCPNSGDYYIVFGDIPDGFEFTSTDEGADDTIDSDANENGVTDCFEVNDEDDPTLDAGIFQPRASLGDTVFLDEDQDGIQDDGEEGVEGVTVNLLDCDGNELDSTTTDASGNYSFTDLDPNVDYIVEFELPDGFEFSPADQGGDDAADSDAGDDGRTPCTDLAPGENNPTLDAGIFIPCDITPEVTSVDPICLGEEVTLIASGGNQFQWSADGEVIEGATAASLTVSPDQTTVYSVLVTDTTQFECFGEVSTTVLVNPLTPDVVAETTVCEGEEFVWDFNGETYTSADSPVVLEVTDDNGCPYTATLTINEFPVTPDVVEEVIVCEGDSFTWDFNGETYTAADSPVVLEVTDDNGCPYTATLTISEEDKVNIGDFVFEDVNANGIQDDGETGINGITVELYMCNDGDNSDGVLVDITTTSNDASGEAGFYNFEVCPNSGEYYLVFSDIGDDFEFTDSNFGDVTIDSDAHELGVTECFSITNESDSTRDAGLVSNCRLIVQYKVRPRDPDGTYTTGSSSAACLGDDIVLRMVKPGEEDLPDSALDFEGWVFTWIHADGFIAVRDNGVSRFGLDSEDFGTYSVSWVSPDGCTGNASFELSFPDEGCIDDGTRPSSTSQITSMFPVPASSGSTLTLVVNTENGSIGTVSSDATFLRTALPANKETISVSLFDYNGRLVQPSRTYDITKGRDVVEFDLSYLESGSYIVKIDGYGWTDSKSIIIK